MRHTLLRDTDAVSMFNSLEVRVPFLDNRLIDYALTLPMEYKYNKSKGGKAILKELLLRRNKSLGYLLNPKKGFVFPLDYWLRRYFKAEVYKSILAEPSEILEIFDYLKLKKLLDDFYNGRNIYYMKIWTIFVLSKWAKSFGMTL